MAKWPLAKWLSDLWLKWLNDLWLKWLSDLWLWLPILLSSWNAVKMHLNLWRCWRLLCCWWSYWQQPLWMMLDTYVYVLQSLVIGNDTNVSGQHLWNIELWWIWGWMVEFSSVNKFWQLNPEIGDKKLVMCYSNTDGISCRLWQMEANQINLRINIRDFKMKLM